MDCCRGLGSIGTFREGVTGRVLVCERVVGLEVGVASRDLSSRYEVEAKTTTVDRDVTPLMQA